MRMRDVGGAAVPGRAASVLEAAGVKRGELGVWLGIALGVGVVAFVAGVAGLFG